MSVSSLTTGQSCQLGETTFVEYVQSTEPLFGTIPSTEHPVMIAPAKIQAWRIMIDITIKVMTFFPSLLYPGTALLVFIMIYELASKVLTEVSTRFR
jgi:hypothetical protein